MSADTSLIYTFLQMQSIMTVKCTVQHEPMTGFIFSWHILKVVPREETKLIAQKFI